MNLTTQPAPDPLKLLDKGGLFRSRDLEAAGLHRSRLVRLVERGEIERIGRGLYRFPEGEISTEFSIAAIGRRIPQAIVCLLSALRFHEIGTRSPWQVWIGLDRKARKPAFSDFPVRVARFSGEALTYGVQEVVLQGVPVRITSPARTIIDCFRYRNKIGIDIALEALQDGIASRKTTVDAIGYAADVFRMRAVMKPYLMSLSA
ncbi:MAG TPA: type IV toxin-antitoxin system AbiEi family antitoxin domain-containing protein [Thermoanaerobaculia bacterium]|jgi:predicted transcriptional regulator of viral defense system|nr:type IV toxin-antitoxin system AbiEi family antitoxin domain-containing protein [Thermoanaerobaculia bacterium]